MPHITHVLNSTCYIQLSCSGRMLARIMKGSWLALTRRSHWLTVWRNIRIRMRSGGRLSRRWLRVVSSRLREDDDEEESDLTEYTTSGEYTTSNENGTGTGGHWASDKGYSVVLPFAMSTKWLLPSIRFRFPWVFSYIFHRCIVVSLSRSNFSKFEPTYDIH